MEICFWQHLLQQAMRPPCAPGWYAAKKKCLSNLWVFYYEFLASCSFLHLNHKTTFLVPNNPESFWILGFKVRIAIDTSPGLLLKFLLQIISLSFKPWNKCIHIFPKPHFHQDKVKLNSLDVCGAMCVLYWEDEALQSFSKLFHLFYNKIEMWGSFRSVMDYILNEKKLAML